MRLPDGSALMHADGLSFHPGERTLLTGPSGSGKSTLFRAIAGIWPFGEGQVLVPEGADHDAPAAAALHPDRNTARCRDLSRRGGCLHGCRDRRRPCAPPSCRRSRIASTRSGHGARPCRSASSSAWRSPARSWPSPTGCSSTRRPRLSTSRPRQEVYRIIREKLPNTTVVSIGHRSTLAAYHDRRIDMKKTEGGLSTPVDMRQAEPAE